MTTSRVWFELVDEISGARTRVAIVCCTSYTNEVWADDPDSDCKGFVCRFRTAREARHHADEQCKRLVAAGYTRVP